MKRSLALNWWKRLETRMVLQAAAAALLPMLALAAFASYTIYNSQVQNAYALQQELAARADVIIEEALQNDVKALQLQANGQNWTTLSDRDLFWQLSFLLHSIPSAQDIALLASNGREIQKVSRLQLITPADLANLHDGPAFSAAQKGQVGWGRAYVSRNGEPLLRVIVPQIDPESGRPQYYLAAVLSLRGLWDKVIAFRVGQQGKMYIIDDRGRLLADPDFSLVLAETSLAQTSLFSDLRYNRLSHLTYTNMDGVKVLGGAVAIAPLHWWVVVEQPVAEALAPAQWLLYLLFLGLLLAIIASAVPGWQIAQHVTHPIAQLSDDAVIVGNGDLSRRSNIHRDDEIGRLAEAFNQMVADLQAYATGLEERVAERTAELQVALSRAEESDRLKSAFLATVSHELRTPIASIKGFGETLLSEDVEWDRGTQADFLQTIVREADRLRDLVDQLLDMAKLESGTLRLRKRPFGVQRVLQEACTRMQTINEDHTITLDIEEQLPPAYVDPERILNVMQNLLENAGKYAPAHTPIRVNAHREGADILVSVTDDGPGIQPEVLPHLFERFYRGVHFDAPGSGLGLALCKGLIEAHGGRIWVESPTGARGGTTVYFTLPIAAESSHGFSPCNA